jgi:CRISPR-associated protein Cas2
VKVSGFRAMWLLVLFDLPVRTKPQRKRATEFRRDLLMDGFTMMQFSVYMRPCASEENAATHLERVRRSLPPLGSVFVMQITDKQFGRMLCFEGKQPVSTEQMPKQLEFF